MGKDDVVVAAAMRGRGKDNKQQLEVSNNEYAHTITTVQKDSMVSKGLKVRRIIPKEAWRLMGFRDEDFEKASKVNSNTQL